MYRRLFRTDYTVTCNNCREYEYWLSHRDCLVCSGLHICMLHDMYKSVQCLFVNGASGYYYFIWMLQLSYQRIWILQDSERPLLNPSSSDKEFFESVLSSAVSFQQFQPLKIKEPRNVIIKCWRQCVWMTRSAQYRCSIVLAVWQLRKIFDSCLYLKICLISVLISLKVNFKSSSQSTQSSYKDLLEKNFIWKLKYMSHDSFHDMSRLALQSFASWMPTFENSRVPRPTLKVDCFNWWMIVLLLKAIYDFLRIAIL